MTEIFFIDRRSQKKMKEDVYGEAFVKLLYNTPFFSTFFQFIFTRSPLFSKLYGFYQKSAFSKKKVLPFIEKYSIDMKECVEAPENFSSFNDFFIRKIKRKINYKPQTILAPADGRHLFIESIEKQATFYVKGQKFNLESFLQNKELIERFAGGSMIISRLCPVDYHRFHAPAAGHIKNIREKRGILASVNPIALRRNLAYLWENKRMFIEVEGSTPFLFVPIGATNVGTICLSTKEGDTAEPGDEMGWFEFGGSCVITLFEKGTVYFDPDLLFNSQQQLETYIQMGDPIGFVNL